MAAEADLLRRLAARDAQTACFEELALLFACLQDRLADLESAARIPAQSSAATAETATTRGDGRGAEDDQRPELQREQQEHEQTPKPNEGDKVKKDTNTDTAAAASGSFPKSVFELQRELLRVRNEGGAIKISLTEARERLRQERAQRLRVEDELQATRESLQAAQNELRALRAQHKRTEEKYLEVAARNHDLEARIVEEKLKVAETLNAMNDMIQQQQGRGGASDADVAALLASATPKDGKKEEEDREDEGATRGTRQSAQAWTSNVGVQLPTEWRVLSEGAGVSVVSLAYNDEGTLIVAGGSDGVLRLWSPQFYNEVSRSESVRQPILSVDMKSRYVLGTCDRSCYVWQVDTPSSAPTLVHRLSGGHTGSVVAGRLTPDCRYAATGGRKIKIWDVSSGNVVRTVDCMSKCLALDVNEQGTLLVSGHVDKGIRLWDMRTGERAGVVTALHTNPLTSVSFSKLGDIVTAAMDNRLAILDQRKLGEEPPRYLSDREFRANQWWCKACVSPGAYTSGSLLAAAGSKTGSLFIWDMGSLQRIYSEQAHAQPITCVAWSPTGSQLASVDSSGAIVCWSATSR